jgi:hypothetical protein
MKGRSHVLFVGAPGSSNMAHHWFLKQRGFVLAVVQGYRDLYQIDMHDGCEIAVLHQTLSEKELIEASHFVRRRWPLARILIVRPEQWWIEDALYDDRVVPGADPETLLAAVERLAG